MPKYQAEQKTLQKAKMQLMSMPNTIFYSTILFSLVHKFTEDIPTAATDGKTLWINPDFWNKQDPHQKVGLLVHEVLHVALNHMTRCGERDPNNFNVAADHCINLLLLSNGYTLPNGGLQDWQYTDMSTEVIYNLLPSNPDKGGMSSDVVYASGKDKADIQDHIAGIVLKASTQAQIANSDPGAIPGEVGILLDKHLNPKLFWNIILQNYMSQFAKNDYSFSKPNRRFLPEYYLPTAHSEGVCNIVAAFDISGSTTDEMVMGYTAELIKIQQSLQPDKLTVLGFDTKIQSEQVFTQESNILKELDFQGRGGTDITPVLEWATKHKPEVMLIFSDGEFYEKPDPKVPIIWIISDPNWKCSYGKIIYYESETN